MPAVTVVDQTFEVGNAHAAVLVDEDVLGLDVAVDDAAFVRVLQRIAQLRHDLQHVGAAEPALFEQLPQVGAVDVVHDQVAVARGLAEAVHADDAWMVEARQRARLATADRTTT